MTDKPDLVEVVAQSIWEAWRLSVIAPDAYREVSRSVLEAARRNHPDAKSPKAIMDTAREEASAALGSIGIPIDVLQALSEGRMVAMPAAPDWDAVEAGEAALNAAFEEDTRGRVYAVYRALIASRPHGDTVPSASQDRGGEVQA